MTDIAAFGSLSGHARAPLWAPRGLPATPSVVHAASGFGPREGVTVSFGAATSPKYPRALVACFMGAGITTGLSLASLVLAPLFATESVSIFLYFTLAAGLGVLALTVRRAERIRERK